MKSVSTRPREVNRVNRAGLKIPAMALVFFLFSKFRFSPVRECTESVRFKMDKMSFGVNRLESFGFGEIESGIDIRPRTEGII